MNRLRETRGLPSLPGRDAQSAQLVARLEELRQLVRLMPPATLAERAAAQFAPVNGPHGELCLTLWRAPVTVTVPEFVAHDAQHAVLSDVLQALLLYYFHTADGAPLAGRWVSFADLPAGRMYAQAFQGYSGDALVKAFDSNLNCFKRACLAAGGHPVEAADAAFVFLALPRVPLLVTYWLGDEDFPSACNVLFDAHATHYLPIDACAVLGGMLAARVKRMLP
ncbi:MAG: DUF3786 domain-containing protein [Anaerolineales bacterium]